MNHYNAGAYLPLVQALADGELQLMVGDKWRDVSGCEEIHFIGPPGNYRRKPKPRELWQLWATHACTGEDVMLGQFTDLQSVEYNVTKLRQQGGGEYKIVHFSEVL